MLTSRSATERVTLQRNDGTPGSRGAIDGSWTTVDTVSAKVVDKSSGEKFQANEDQLVREVTFAIRYRTDIDETWRIGWGDDTFEIIGRPKDPNFRKWELNIDGRIIS